MEAIGLMVANIIKKRLAELCDVERVDGLTERNKGEKEAYIELLRTFADYFDSEGIISANKFLRAAITDICCISHEKDVEERACDRVMA